MADVFRTHDKQGKPHPKWRFRFRDHKGRRRKATGTTSKTETIKLAQQVQAREDMIRNGQLPKPVDEPATDHPFSKIKDEYLAWGASQGGRGGRPWSKDHNQKRTSHLAWWQAKLGLAQLSDLVGVLPKVEKQLRTLKQQGKSGKTINNYAEALTAFCEWCALKSRRYLPENPLAGLKRFDDKPQQQRRALTAEEIRLVLDRAPDYRSLLYQVAFVSAVAKGRVASLDG